jgi:hypothetical protein
MNVVCFHALIKHTHNTSVPQFFSFAGYIYRAYLAIEFLEFDARDGDPSDGEPLFPHFYRLLTGVSTVCPNVHFVFTGSTQKVDSDHPHVKV